MTARVLVVDDILANVKLLEARLQAEATLAQVQARLQEVEAELKVRTDIMNVTSIVSESDKKGDIVSINDKFVEVSKYSRNELIGAPHSTTRHPDMHKETFKQLWQTIGRGEIFRGVIKNRAKDGTPYYVDAVIAPILGENGKPMKYLGVRYDITAAEIERQNARGILGEGHGAATRQTLGSGPTGRELRQAAQRRGPTSEQVDGRQRAGTIEVLDDGRQRARHIIDVGEVERVVDTIDTHGRTAGRGASKGRHDAILVIVNATVHVRQSHDRMTQLSFTCSLREHALGLYLGVAIDVDGGERSRLRDRQVLGLAIHLAAARKEQPWPTRAGIGKKAPAKARP